MTIGPILVSAAVIRDGDKILLAQRFAEAGKQVGQWEFPGGKVEYGEHPEACLIREIKEELNIDIQIDSLLGVSSHVYDKPGKSIHIILLCYICDYNSGELKCLDAADAKWILPKEIDQFDLAEADKPLLPALYEKLSKS